MPPCTTLHDGKTNGPVVLYGASGRRHKKRRGWGGLYPHGEEGLIWFLKELQYAVWNKRIVITAYKEYIKHVIFPSCCTDERFIHLCII